MSTSCYQRGDKRTDRSSYKKREDFKNKIRREHLQEIFKQKRKQFAEKETRASESPQTRTMSDQFGYEKNNRKPKSQHLANHSQKNYQNQSQIPVSGAIQGIINIFSQQKGLKQKNQLKITNLNGVPGNLQPPIQANNLLNQNEYSPNVQNTPKFINLGDSRHIKQNSQNTSSNRQNHQMKNSLLNNGKTNQHILSFAPVHEIQKVQNVQYNLNDLSFMPPNGQVVDQSFEMQAQISNQSSPFDMNNIVQNSVLNEAFVNMSPPSNTAPLDFGFVNILSNDRILENPYQQNDYLRSIEIFKQCLGQKNNSPIQEQMPNIMHSPGYSRQILIKIPSPEQSYPLRPQHYIRNDYQNFHRKIVNNFEEINQTRRRGQIRIQKKQAQKINAKKEENPFKKKFKVFDPKVHQIKAQKVNPPSNFYPKFINWGNVIKKHSKYAVLDKVLGKGSYGAVYLGVNMETGQKIAVKKISVNKSKHLIEVQCLKQIKHENIVSLYEYVHEEREKQCYLFMEYCEENLREKLQKFKQQKKSRVQLINIKINFIQQLINGMNELNDKGYIHRDLKLQNILIKNNSVIKICDFGLCRKVNKKLQVESVRCGTPYTMAPQIFFHPKNHVQNPTYTEKADIFSLAVILHEIIYDLHPFDYEEDRLKNMQIYQRRRTKQMAKRLSQEFKINILWIEEIIQGGLKRLQSRISWDQVMQIFRFRIKPKQSVFGVKKQWNEQNKIKRDFMKNENIQNQQNCFKKKNIVKEMQAKPFQVQAPPITKPPNYPKFQKRKKNSDPEEKKFNYLDEAERLLGKNSRKQQQQQILLQKDNPQSAGKSKQVSKKNESRKIEIKIDFKKEANEFKNLRSDSRKQQVGNIIKSSVQKKDEEVIKIKENQCVTTKLTSKVAQKQHPQARNFILILVILNTAMLIGMVLFGIYEQKSTMHSSKSLIQ